MTNLRFGIPLLAATALALVGCADESPWGNSSNQKGSIDISLLADASLKSSAPVLVSDDADTRADDDPYNLATYTTVPTAEDFSIQLIKSDGSYNKTFTSLEAFREEAKNQFVAGAYTLTAFYGEKGKIAFNNPYYETSASFTVLANDTHKLDLYAGLGNSMVKINFTDEFKSYMSDYYVGLRTEGQTDEFKYTAGEPRPVFIDPYNTSLTVHYTTRETRVSGAKSIGQFVPLAKTLHNLTLDVRVVDGVTGLAVAFDEGLTDEDIFIDLSNGFNDMMQAPEITCSGFSNGDTVDLLEGYASTDDLSMNVVADAGIKSAVLTINSTNTQPAWGNSIDLCNATALQQSQLADAGIKAYGFFSNPGNAASLNLTNYGASIANGTYTVSLVITDNNNNVTEPAKVVFESGQIQFGNVNGTVPYASVNASLSLDFNGLDPMDIVFESADIDGNDQVATIESFSETPSTRSFDSKNYTYSLRLPTIATKRQIEVKASNRNSGKSYGSYYLAVTSIPDYSISQTDAFAHYAYLKVGVSDAAMLPIVTENLRLQNSNLFIYSRDLANGVIMVTGAKDSNGNVTDLYAGGTYTTKYSIFAGDYSDNLSHSFSMESDLSIPNGDFSATGTSVSSGTINVGGEYRVTVGFISDTYQNYSSYSYAPPSGWATVNTLTAYTGSNPRNSWFEVPSSWVEDGQAVMRNVGYNHNGTVPSTSGGQMNTNYYCTNTPSESDLINAAGEVFLGSYLFDGSESRTDGTAFASRPSSISFDYTYTLKNGVVDNGYAYVEVLDANGNIIGHADPFDIPEAGTVESKTINITYDKFGASAAVLKLGFKSSNQSNPPIHIPTGSDLDEGVTVIVSESNRTISDNSYHALATGSVLTIDNVTANYDIPGIQKSANAPKRNASKKSK